MADKRPHNPNWQPIQFLPLLTQMIDGMLADATEHYATLEEARPKPQVTTDILTLAGELKNGTIEVQLAKSDYELGLEAFRKQQRPRTGPKQP